MGAVTRKPCDGRLAFYEIDEHEVEHLTMSFTCRLPFGHHGDHEWMRDKLAVGP